MCVATTYCHLVLHLGIDYVRYREIADWLGDYYYTIPAERVGIIPELGRALMKYTGDDLPEARRLSYNIEGFNREDQLKIAKWISG